MIHLHAFQSATSFFTLLVAIELPHRFGFTIYGKSIAESTGRSPFFSIK
jgi:hypothetical protein